MSAHKCLLLTSISTFATTADCEQGWYTGILGGITNYYPATQRDLNDIDNSSGGARFHFKNGYAIGGLLGYKLAKHFRVEGEITYRKNNGDRFTFPGLPSRGNLPGYINSVVFMLNGYYDVVNYCGFIPYLGGGLGKAHMVNHIPTLKSSTNVLAYQLIGGIRYNLSTNFSTDLSYRYLSTQTPHYDFIEPNTGSISKSSLPYHVHNVFISLVYRFA